MLRNRGFPEAWSPLAYAKLRSSWPLPWAEFLMLAPSRSLGPKDPLEKEIATYSTILAWRLPWIDEPGWLQSMVLQRVRHDWWTKHTIVNSIHCCQLYTTLYTVSTEDHSYRFILINHGGAVGTHIVTLKMYDFCKVLHDFTYMWTLCNSSH